MLIYIPFSRQNTKNVFGLGDACALPTAKTGAAIRKQAPVVVENVYRMLKQMPLAEKTYEGYSSCPIVTGYGKMLLCEFKYDNVRDSDPLLSKFVDTTKEKWSMWILKKIRASLVILEHDDERKDVKKTCWLL